MAARGRTVSAIQREVIWSAAAANISLRSSNIAAALAVLTQKKAKAPPHKLPMRGDHKAAHST